MPLFTGSKTCFVAMPFGDASTDPEKHALWTEVYELLKRVVERCGLQCVRADEICRPGSVIRDVVTHLATADVVIAEMTDRNPNVFYELGVRHALSDRTILLAQRSEDVPFDLQPYRHIAYRFTPRGAQELEEKLRLSLLEVLKEPASPDSPVREYLATRRLARADDPEASGSLVALERELEHIRGQNYQLAADLKEVMSVVAGLSVTRSGPFPSDLEGTWSEVETSFHQQTFIAVMDGLVVLAYEGTWPGCSWGTMQDGLLRIAWSRFDETMSGNGYYRVDPALHRMAGGIWFDDTDIELMLGRKDFLEKHVLAKASVEIDGGGREVLRRARTFLTQRGVLGASTPSPIAQAR